MASFAEKTYRRARKVIEDKGDGAEIAFTRYLNPQEPTPPYDETDPDEIPVETGEIESLAGLAVEVMGSEEEYVALRLTEREAVTLYFVPDEIGFIPGTGDTAVWASKVRTVQQVFPIRPGGLAVAARVIMA